MTIKYVKSVSLLIAIVAGLPLLAHCSDSSKSDNSQVSVEPPNSALPITLKTTVLNSNLTLPWALGFLPDKRMLVTEKAGKLKLLNAQGELISEVTGTPAVFTSGQGGLLDIALQTVGADQWVYLSYAEPGDGAQSNTAGTAVAKAKLVGSALIDWQVIFRQTPKFAGGSHFGSRLVFDSTGHLFVTLGDHGQDSTTSPTADFAQNNRLTIGKVIRIDTSGTAAKDNPNLGADAMTGIYSFGHRNPQSAALHPKTGELWVAEHGPQGGDEINRVQPGKNYGWPLRSYGCPYGSPVGDTCRIGGGVHAPLYVEPLSTWTPTSIAPSGLVFYESDYFAAWRGQVFMGSMTGKSLWRLKFDGDKEVAREALLNDLGERLRDVRQGPEGMLYLLTDSGKLIRVEKQ